MGGIGSCSGEISLVQVCKNLSTFFLFSAASHLGLHCLHMAHGKDARRIWINSLSPSVVS